MAIDSSLFPAPVFMLAPAGLFGLGLAGYSVRQRLGFPRGDAFLLWGALVLLLAGLVGAALLFAGADRMVPVAAGIALGLALGVLWEWLPGDPSNSEPVGPIGSGLAALALIGGSFAAPVAIANALLGLVAGWGALQLLSCLTGAPEGPPRDSEGLALGTVALAAAAAAWGEKLAPSAHAGLPLAVGVLAALVAGLALAGLLGDRRDGLAGRLVAMTVFLLASLLVALGLYGLPAALGWGLAAAAVCGVLAPALVPAAGRSAVSALAFLMVAGGTLVLENRLAGIVGIGLGGLALALGARSPAAARPLVALVLAIFSARVWMQLFLDRTLLTGYGIDLTHPYALAALVVGGLLPAIALAGARLARPSRVLGVAWAVAVAGMPVWIGYFVHLEALGSLLAGLLLAGFALGAQEDAETTLAVGTEALALMPALLTTAVATTLLAAPWLLTAMEATRQQRLVVFVAGVILLILAVAHHAFWTARRRRTA